MPSIPTRPHRAAALSLALLLGAGHGGALRAQDIERGERVPFVTGKLGSFLVGGTVIDSPGTFDPIAFPAPPAGQSAHGDHAYVQYFIPPNARAFPLVMWHGGGQYGKTWETTPDGRKGYQTIFAQRGFATYVLDQPRRARGGTADSAVISPSFNDASLFNIFRLGTWDESGPHFFPGVSFPRDSISLDQYFRQTAPNTGAFDAEVFAEAVAELLRKIGPAVLVTHSQSGIYGWLAALKEPDLVKGIVSYEPTQFVLPEGETPVEVETQVPFWLTFLNSLSPNVSEAEFRKLAAIPIQLVYGDNIPTESTQIAGHELWYITRFRSAQFVDALNRLGGDAEILYLPDAGLQGNTHFPFSDRNNVKVADLMRQWLHEKGLDVRSRDHTAVARE